MGDRIWSDGFGIAEIAFLSGDQAGIIHHNGRKGIINVSRSNIRFALPSDGVNTLNYAEENNDIAPSEPTFVAHPDTDWQSQGSHLAIYNNGIESRFVDAIPELIASAKLMPSNLEADSLPLGFGHFEQGMYLASRMVGADDHALSPELLCIIGIEEQNGQRQSVFASMFPYWQNESRFTFKLDQVFVWQAGLEANCVGSINGSDIAFFVRRQLSCPH